MPIGHECSIVEAKSAAECNQFYSNASSKQCIFDEQKLSCTDAEKMCIIQPICGNGILELHEECDDGNVEIGDGCDSSCKKEVVLSPMCN